MHGCTKCKSLVILKSPILRKLVKRVNALQAAENYADLTSATSLTVRDEIFVQSIQGKVTQAYCLRDQMSQGHMNSKLLNSVLVAAMCAAQARRKKSRNFQKLQGQRCSSLDPVVKYKYKAFPLWRAGGSRSGRPGFVQLSQACEFENWPRR